MYNYFVTKKKMHNYLLLWFFFFFPKTIGKLSNVSLLKPFNFIYMEDALTSKYTILTLHNQQDHHPFITSIIFPYFFLRISPTLTILTSKFLGCDHYKLILIHVL